METITIKVASKSDVKKIARAIIGFNDEGKKVELQAIGASAVNQAIKAIIVARGTYALENKSINMIPAFVEVDIDGEKRTGIKFILNID